jgi:histidinol dehydrogenase
MKTLLNTTKNPSVSDWEQLCSRPSIELNSLRKIVNDLLNKIKREGDKAIKELTLQFDNVSLNEISLSSEEKEGYLESLSPELKEAIDVAAENIRKFHEIQITPTLSIETMPGIQCWQKTTPIEKIGIYIPGGSAPLFSTVLMLGIPASIAGCDNVILCTPPDKNGLIHPAIYYAALKCGITSIFKVGGVQAIGGMAFGSESIPPVYKIFGPGNQYVTMAKQIIQQKGVAIDLPAGPSEVLIYADKDSPSRYIAADLLAQAEHGPDSQVILVTTHEGILSNVEDELENQLEDLPRSAIARKALLHSRAIIFDSLEDSVHFINQYAPEHLILMSKNADEIANKVRNAGSVFIGKYSPESVGDYASGTNHTLPTNGYAKMYSGVNLDAFTKKITYQKLTEEGIQNIGPLVEKMAIAEELVAHQRAVSIRLNDLN